MSKADKVALETFFKNCKCGHAGFTHAGSKEGHYCLVPACACKKFEEAK